MATVHSIMQEKGGCAKTFIAWNFAQYLIEYTKDPALYDSDPLNKDSSLSSYKAFNVKPLKLLTVEQNLDKHQFDELMETIFGLPEDAHVLIDNGSSSFNPLISYFQENDAISYLIDEGHAVYVHAVLAGGKELKDTTKGIINLSKVFQYERMIVPWINPFFGKVAEAGKTFEESKFYKDHQAIFNTIIHLPEYTDLLQLDILEVLKQALTYEEVKKGKGKGSLSQRMNIRRVLSFRKEIFNEIDKLELV